MLAFALLTTPDRLIVVALGVVAPSLAFASLLVDSIVAKRVLATSPP